MKRTLILTILFLLAAPAVVFAQGTNTCQANNCPPVVTVASDPTGNLCVNAPQVTIYNGNQYGCSNGTMALSGGGGDVSSTGLTSGYYPIATGAQAIGNGTITDFGTQLVLIHGLGSAAMSSSGITLTENSPSSPISFNTSLSGGYVYFGGQYGRANLTAGMELAGVSGGQPGALQFLQGTTPPTPPANTVQLNAPTSVTAYNLTLPGAQGAGALTNDGLGNLSFTPSGGSGTVLYTAAEYSNGTCTTAATIAPANGNRQSVTLTAGDTCALTFTQPSTGTISITIKIIQSSSSSYNGGISGGKWPAGTVPTITQTAAAVDFISCYLDGTNTYCVASQNFQ